MSIMGTVYDLERNKALGIDTEGLLAKNRKLREALKVAKDYLDYSLGSPGYAGSNPYPIIEAALKE